MRLLVLFLCLTTSFVCFAQQNKKQHRPIFESNNYLNKGWHFAPGATYTLVGSASKNTTILSQNDSSLTGTFSPGSAFGIHLEAGRHHIPELGGLMDIVDYGFSIKQVRGTEVFEGELSETSTGSVLASFNSKSKFSTWNAGVFLNISNVWQMNAKTYLQNSLGLNFDYRVSLNQSSDSTAFWPQQTQDKTLLQLHYKLGLGIKDLDRLFIVPSIEIPIINLMTFEKGKGSVAYFSSRYRPIMFTLRFMLLDDRKGQECTDKPVKKGGHELWGPEMRKKKKKR